MSPHVVLPHRFTCGEYAFWTAEWKAVRDQAELRIGLKKGTFIDPSGVVLLAAGIAARQETGKPTSLSVEDPEDDTVRYLQRMDFFEQLGIDRPERFTRQHVRQRFVTLRRITDERIARALADDAAAFLEEHFVGKNVGSVLRFARFIFEELGVNIVHHSERTGTGFGMAQAWPQQGRIQIAFADAGVGFRESLCRNYEYRGRIEDDAHAIELCLQQDVSGGGEGHSGLGLFLLTQLSDKAKGTVRIGSGEALVRRRPDGANHSSGTAGWQGAWISFDAKISP